ncbi:MAG TPA: HupE/UreJ family protein [Nitrospira sp.]|nr:HupE/UreJ family protein [Nitrospira sp.]
MRHFIFASLIALFVQPAWAHKPSDSYMSLTVQETQISGQWDIALRDLNDAIGLDTDDDGAISWGEVRTKHTEIASYAFSRLKLQSSEVICPIAISDQLVDHHTDGAYAVLQFIATCPTEIHHLTIDYRLLFDLDAQHKGLLLLSDETHTQTAIFSQESPVHSFTMGEGSVWQAVRQYLREGVWHIWLGFDHLLFLVTLLVPAVLIRQGGQWKAVPDFAIALREVVSIVTAFTVAHSLTLSLATFGLIWLPSGLVESAIAGSVVLAGIANLYPRITQRRWLMAFGFGLIHGFGFAAVLSDLGLPTDSLLLSLISFNVGVEIGQLAIVAGLLPLAYAVRDSRSYQPLVLRAGSIAIILVALAWLAERVLDISLFSIQSFV